MSVFQCETASGVGTPARRGILTEYCDEPPHCAVLCCGLLYVSSSQSVIDGNKVILNRPGPDAKVEDVEFEPNEVYAIDMVVSSGEHTAVQGLNGQQLRRGLQAAAKVGRLMPDRPRATSSVWPNVRPRVWHAWAAASGPGGSRLNAALAACLLLGRGRSCVVAAAAPCWHAHLAAGLCWPTALPADTALRMSGYAMVSAVLLPHKLRCC